MAGAAIGAALANKAKEGKTSQMQPGIYNPQAPPQGAAGNPQSSGLSTIASAIAGAAISSKTGGSGKVAGSTSNNVTSAIIEKVINSKFEANDAKK